MNTRNTIKVIAYPPGFWTTNDCMRINNTVLLRVTARGYSHAPTTHEMATVRETKSSSLITTFNISTHRDSAKSRMGNCKASKDKNGLYVVENNNSSQGVPKRTLNQFCRFEISSNGLPAPTMKYEPR